MQQLKIVKCEIDCHFKNKQEVGDDLSVYVLNLEFGREKIKIKGKHVS